MTLGDEEVSELPTSEGRLIVALSKALFGKDIDAAFRIMGQYLDEHNLQVTETVIEEYRFAERIK